MNKKLPVYLILISFLSLLIACKKEITFDLSLPSVGTLQCARYSLNGTYMKGLSMDEFNHIFMRVKVNRRGTYHIESLGADNGIKFSADGVFEEDGVQDVKLFATGTPVFSDTFYYKIVYYQPEENDTCIIPVIFERPTNVQNAVMTFEGQPNTCNITSSDIRGMYMVNVPMQPSNTVTVHANVSIPGVYFIQTTRINGVRFTAEGEVTTTGPVDISFIADGTPLRTDSVGAPFYYPVTLGGNSCAISLTFEPFLSPITAFDAQCTNANLSGTYTQGEQTNPDNDFVEIPVIFPAGSVAGTYNITTNEVNGVSFSGSGVLDPNGNNIIKLTASGTPTYGNPTPYTYTFSYPVSGGGTSTCSFDVPVGGDYITALVNGDLIAFNFNPRAVLGAIQGISTLEISGQATDGAFPDLKISVTLGPGASFNSGTFSVNDISSQGGSMYCTHSLSNINFFKAQSVSGTVQPDPFTLVTLVTGTPSRIEGTFSGTLYKDGIIGQPTMIIRNGVYSLPLQ